MTFKLTRAAPGAFMFLASCAIGGATQAEGPQVASYWPHVPSLAQLTTVRLGMPYAELRAARPGVAPKPYVGAAEVVGTDTLLFHFRADDRAPGSAIGLPHDGAPGDAAPLLAVESWTMLADSADAETVWMDRLRMLSDAHPGRVACFTYEHGARNRAAVVEGPDVVVGVLLYPERTLGDTRGTRTIPPVIRTFVTSELDALVVGAERRAAPCGE